MRKMKVPLILGLTLLLFISGPSWAKATIYLKSFARVRGEYIKLGEIANIEGEEELTKKLEQIEVTSSPLPGRSRTLNRGYIMVRLYQNNISRNEISFKGAKEVKVTSSFNLIEKERLLKIAKELVIPFFKGKEVKIEIDKQRFSSSLKVPPGKLRLEGGTPSFTYLHNFCIIPVRVYINDKLYQTISLPLKIKVFEEVLVTQKRLLAGHILTQEDLRKEKRQISNSLEDVATNLKEALGKRVIRAIPAHTPLLKKILRPPLLVRQGDLVRLIGKGLGIEVITQGRALEEGGKGEIIEVVNVNSLKKLKAKIVDAGVVEIMIN